MPRKARVRSSNGIYHVVVQGVRGENIFGPRDAKLRYMEKLYEYGAQFGMEVFAFCILDNHAHLVVREGQIDISGLMRRLGVSYSCWYKKEYQLPGGKVYRGRYLSQPVPLWELPGVISYVEKEPMRLGLCEQAFAYPFSSAVRSGETENAEVSCGNYLEETACGYGSTQEEARRILLQRFGTDYALKLRCLSREERDSLLRELRFEDHLSIQTIAGACGIGRGVVQRIKRVQEK